MAESSWQQTTSDNSTMRMHLSVAEGPGPFPGMVVVQHQWGVDEFMQQLEFVQVARAVAAPLGPGRRFRIRLRRHVRPALQQMRGERVPQRVRADGLRDVRVAHVAADDAIDAAGGETPAALVQEEG